MFYKYILTVVVLLLCVGITSAWDEETPLIANETLSIDWHPAMGQSTVNTPFRYIDGSIMDTPFTSNTFVSRDSATINYVYKIYRYIWDGTNYISIENCNVTIETSIDLAWDDTIDAYVLPANFNEQMDNGFLVKRYFQNLINSDSIYCSQYNNSDTTSTPDIFYTEVEVDAGDGDPATATMYTSVDSKSEKDLRAGISNYGFSLDGRGSDGGSGAIYEGLNMYGSGDGDTSGLGNAFEILFWIFIPIIFLLCAVRFVQKM